MTRVAARLRELLPASWRRAAPRDPFALDPVAFCRRLTLEGWDLLLAAEEESPPLLLVPTAGPWLAGLRALALYRPACRLLVPADSGLAGHRPRLETLFPHRLLDVPPADDEHLLAVPIDGDGSVGRASQLRPNAPRLEVSSQADGDGWRVRVRRRPSD